MVRLTPRQRTALGETLRGLANLVAAALVLSQVVAQPSPSWTLLITGVAAWLGFAAIALWLIGEA